MDDHGQQSKEKTYFRSKYQNCFIVLIKLMPDAYQNEEMGNGLIHICPER